MSPVPSIVGSVVERSSSSSSRPKAPGAVGVGVGARATGFPSVQHRSKSAFARAREDRARSKLQDSDGVKGGPPVVRSSGAAGRIAERAPTSPLAKEAAAALEDKNADWREEISLENARRVAAMSEEERAQEREEILARFGPDVGALLRKAREARESEQHGRKRQIGEISPNAGDEERERRAPHERGHDVSPTPASSDDALRLQHERANGVQHEIPPNVGYEERKRRTSHERVYEDASTARNADDERRSQRERANGYPNEHAPTVPRPSIPTHAIHSPRPQRGILVTSASRAASPDSRASTPGRRRLRFAEVKPDDIHVYVSQPPSPKRPVALLLPAPPGWAGTEGDGAGDGAEKIPSVRARVRMPRGGDVEMGGPDATSANSTGAGAERDDDAEPEEGTPEYIRRRFFPHVQPHNPALEWIESAQAQPLAASSSTSTSNSTSIAPPPPDSSSDDDEPLSQPAAPAPLYDLAGLPVGIASSPQHSHGHAHAHHISPAGPGSVSTYTFADLCTLSRSSVPAQQAGALQVLARLVRRVGAAAARRNKSRLKGKGKATASGDGNEEEALEEQEDAPAIRARALAAGLASLEERGSAGVRACAVEVVWACVIGWDSPASADAAFDGHGYVELRPPPVRKDGAEDAKEDSGEGEEDMAIDARDPLSALPLAHFLPLVAQLLAPSVTPLPQPPAMHTSASTSHTLQPASQIQLLQVLYRLARHSTAIAGEMARTPGLVRAVVDAFVLAPGDSGWHVSGDEGEKEGENENENEASDAPGPLAIALLSVLAAAGRASARALVDAGVGDVLLRFVVLYAPSAGTNTSSSTADGGAGVPTSMVSDAILEETLRFYTALANYGLYAHVAADAAAHFARLASVVLVLPRPSPSLPSPHSDSEPHRAHYPESPRPSPSTHLATAYLRLLSTWLTCARDPHATSPPHALRWSQVAGWGWGGEVLGFYGRLMESFADEECRSVGSAGLGKQGEMKIVTAMWDVLAAWLEGCRVNAVRAGEEERAEVFSALKGSFEEGGGARNVVRRVVGLLEGREVDSADEAVGDFPRSMGEVGEAGDCLRALTRLCLACLAKTTDETRREEAEWVLSLLGELEPIAIKLLVHPVWINLIPTSHQQSAQLQDTTSAPPSLALRVRSLQPLSAFLAGVVRLAHALDGKTSQWAALACAVLTRLLPGDEEDAQWIVGEVVKLVGDPVEEGVDIGALAPFLEHGVRPNRQLWLAPRVPTPVSIKNATTQIIPATALQEGEKDFCLPLPRDWPSAALDHLLRSGSSPVFASMPQEWNASEIDVVRATVSLLVYVQRAFAESRDEEVRRMGMGAEETIFACMKVFMLEHGIQQSDSSEEVFRDAIVGRLMEDTLRPFTLGALSSSPPQPPMAPQPDLEEVARRFLGAGTPFFQFYTDFVALYDAISFAHGLFAALLFPPTGMVYARDYRRLLWGDHAHVLRSVRLPLHAALLSPPSLAKFLWPFESDGEMLGWYLRALVKWQLEGLPRLAAVHHVACNVWPDLHCGAGREKRAKMLFLALVGQGRADAVRDVLLYRQTPPVPGKEPETEVVLPPVCFPREGAWVAERLRLVSEWGGMAMRRNLEKLYAKDD